MIIKLEKKDTLSCDDFLFKCSIGKRGLSSRKVEGDKKTPKGIFSLGPLFYRKDRNKKPFTKIKTVNIAKNMGWCDDVNHFKYNCLIKINKKIKHEKLFRKNNIYDLLIPINYNTKKIRRNKGSAIFIHLTNNYKRTLGCIALKENDLLTILKLINKKTKIKII
jgi:L,D-peptidoglycan transpeptidase YkuD (ErfK/YbiS/YcfS/YnhG family)